MFQEQISQPIAKTNEIELSSTMIDDSLDERLVSGHRRGSENNSREEYAPWMDPSVNLRDSALSNPLKFLFALNGFSLAFPVTALLYIVNTRVEMSIALLPTYGAVAFLPNSLRPLYAYLSDTGYRDRLIAFLLILSAISTALTAVIPNNGFLLCFVAAFLRGVTSSWPEFLLGLTLVDHARASSSFDETAALFQSQAATCRNLGSLIASFGALCLISRQGSLHAETMEALLLVAAASNVLGSAVALHFQIGRQVPSTVTSPAPSDAILSYHSIPRQDIEVGTTDVVEPSPLWCSNRGINHNLLLVLLLQITVILLALRQPLEDFMSPLLWESLTFTTMLGLMVSFMALVWSGKWPRSQRVGLFLILRHITPSVSYLMISYLYDIFSKAPFILQLLSLIDMGIASLSAWSYGRFCSRFSSDKTLPFLIFGTTMLASIMSLTQVWMIHVLPALSETPLVQFGVVLIVRGIVSWTGEWNFMPDVVLATTSLKHTTKQPFSINNNNNNTLADSENKSTPGVDVNELQEDRQAINVQYGTLISCIDFGDQLGAFALGALVTALNVSREGNWVHLDALIQVCGVLGVFSVVFIYIIR